MTRSEAKSLSGFINRCAAEGGGRYLAEPLFIGTTAWVLLVRLSGRTAGASLPIGLALVIGAASMTIMLSGYLTGGMAGLPLSAAVLGGSLAALASAEAAHSPAPIGIAVVGLASLLVIGRFFGAFINALVNLLAGFGTAANLRQHFTKAVGVAPMAYRRTFRCPDEVAV